MLGIDWRQRWDLGGWYRGSWNISICRETRDEMMTTGREHQCECWWILRKGYDEHLKKVGRKKMDRPGEMGSKVHMNYWFISWQYVCWFSLFFSFLFLLCTQQPYHSLHFPSYPPVTLWLVSLLTVSQSSFQEKIRILHHVIPLPNHGFLSPPPKSSTLTSKTKLPCTSEPRHTLLAVIFDTIYITV